MQRASASMSASVQWNLERPLTRNTPANGTNTIARIAPADMEDGKATALFGAAVVIVNCAVTASVPGVTVLGEKEQLAFAGRPVQESVTPF
jgi:hypothetical protein